MPEIYDLSSPEHRYAIAEEIKRQIDIHCQETYDDGPRAHLGASLIGDPCSRKLWYIFRWVKHKRHSGQMYRLFNRGHREEERFVGWLRGIGFEVKEFDNNWLPTDIVRIGQHKSKRIEELPTDYVEWAKRDGVDLCKKQFRISGVNGHFGGSLDGLGLIPATVITTGDLVLLEFKTSGTGSNKFDKVTKYGMRSAKPLHYAQTCTYGRKHGIKYVLYLMINKDNDNLHVEIEALDWTYGEELERKAEYIIGSQDIPPRLHESESHFDCKFCDYKTVCFHDDHLDVNCRSCKYAKPVEDANWYCEKHDSVIPSEYIKDACGSWEQIC
jgi:hypothetical protein